MTDWIVIPNWDKYQHYKDRRAPWIKDYVEQLQRTEYLNLSLSARGLLHDVRLLWSSHDGQIARHMVAGLLTTRPRNSHWEELEHAGFLYFVASKPLALRARGRALAEIGEKRKRDVGVTRDGRNTDSEFDFNTLLRSVDDA